MASQYASEIAQEAVIAATAASGVRVPLDLTFVTYHEGSLISMGYAFLTFMPLVIVVALVTLILFNRELETAFLMAGILVNSAVCLLLKRILREPRPVGSHKTGHGMPSHHTQFMFFFGSFMLLLLWRRVRFARHIWRQVTGVLTFANSCFVSYSRLYLGVHTVAQVCAGAVAGILFAVVWYWIGEVTARPWFCCIEEWRISQWFCLRDSLTLPTDSEQLYYQRYRELKGKTLISGPASNGNGGSSTPSPHIKTS